VDEGHIERERQVGQTGVICNPKVTLCCGLGGADLIFCGEEPAGGATGQVSSGLAEWLEIGQLTLLTNAVCVFGQNRLQRAALHGLSAQARGV
jgi:hypothetical protein